MSAAIIDGLSEGLRRLNLIVAAITMLMAVSLAAYLVFYHGRSRAARAFAALLALLTWISLGDLFLSTARLEAAHPAAAFWLRFQWLGIAFVAPVYLWFSATVRSSLGERPGARRGVTLLGLAVGGIVLALILGTELLAGKPVGQARRLAPGGRPALCGLRPGLLAALRLGGLGPVARGQVAAASHGRACCGWRPAWWRRSTPFPRLSLVPAAQAPSPTAFRLFITVANIGTAALLLVVAYSLAFQGTLVPDRAIKRELAKYLIQTVLPGACILATAQLVPERLQQSLGLPRDLVFMAATVFGIVGYQIVVRLLKPLIDRLIYGSGGADAIWLRRLDERLLTGEDLSQLLNGILAALCELWRVDAGGILAVVEDRATLDLWNGDVGARGPLLDAMDKTAVAAILDGGGFQPLAGFLCRALRDDAGATEPAGAGRSGRGAAPGGGGGHRTAGERRGARAGGPGGPTAGTRRPARPGAGVDAHAAAARALTGRRRLPTWRKACRRRAIRRPPTSWWPGSGKPWCITGAAPSSPTAPFCGCRSSARPSRATRATRPRPCARCWIRRWNG